jgi:hypothetical protein
LNSARGTRIDREENTLYVSKIFDWFGEDFIRKSGSIEEFIRPYVDEEVRLFLDRKPKISFLKYNWALNAKEALAR